MTCSFCHNPWTLLPAHVIRTAHGWRMQCPACGFGEDLVRACPEERDG